MMTAKEYLEQYGYIESQIKAQTEHAAKLYADLTGHAQRLTGMPRGGGCDWTDVVIELDAMHDSINEQVKRFTALYSEIQGAIAALPNAQERAVLELRYINGWSWTKIAMSLHVDRATAFRIHARALQNIATPCD